MSESRFMSLGAVGWRIFGAVALYGAFHSALASLPVKRWAARRLGLRGAVYRLLFNLVSTLALLPVLALPLRYPDRLLYRLPLPWVAPAVAVQGFGGLLALDASEFSPAEDLRREILDALD